MEIAKYTVGVDFDLKWKKLDRNLKILEKKLAKFSSGRLAFSIDRFVIDQRKLNLALGNALDRASRTTAFQIDRFVIDQAGLTRQMTRALRAASRAASAQTDVTPNARGGISTRQAGVAGGVGGLTARAYTPLLALGFGGYGLGAINRRNQEVVSAQLQTSAIVQQAGGSATQGAQAFDYIRNEGERIGFNYLDAVGDYNKLISGLTGAGISVGDSQGVFTGFSELARVNKLDKTSQNRLFRALSQVAGKNQLMSEELTGQIAEALPGGVAIFAEAYQRQLAAQGRGGGKTGSEAIAELRAAMEKREVKGDILLYAGSRASELAGPSLGAASRASQAEQGRFQNAYNDLAIVASNSGLESGFSRLFRALTDGAKESGPLIESLARGFDNVTKYASAFLLTSQSIQRFFQGRDSFLGDKLFPDAESQSKAFLFLEQTKVAFGEINTLISNSIVGWSQLFSLIESSSVLDRLTQAMNIVANGAGALNALVSGDFSGAADLAKSAGTRVVNTVTAPGRAGANLLLESGTNAANSVFGTNLRARIPAFDADKTTLDYKAEQSAQRRMAAAQANKDGFPTPTGILPIGPGGPVTATFNIYDATNAEEVGQVVNRHLSDLFNSTKLEYSQKE